MLAAIVQRQGICGGGRGVEGSPSTYRAEGTQSPPRGRPCERYCVAMRSVHLCVRWSPSPAGWRAEDAGSQQRSTSPRPFSDSAIRSLRAQSVDNVQHEGGRGSVARCCKRQLVLF